MPLTLVIQATARERRRERSAAELLHAEADRLYPQLRTLWRTIFGDVRAHVPQARLRDALRRGDLVDAENLIRASWMRYGDGPARTLLPVVLQETVSRVAEAITMTAVTSVQFNVQVPEVLHAIDTYAGTQIVGIGETTMQAVRGVLRQGVMEGLPLVKQMEAIEAIVGLTPSQAATIDRLRTRLTAEGKTPAQIARAVEQATRRALRLRAENIARTESMASANMGMFLRTQQDVQAGLLDRERTRRHWLVAADERLCFCKGTYVATPQGEQVIELLQPGDCVLTPEGKRQLLATSVRPYNGPLVLIQSSDDRVAVMTVDHPVLVNGMWCEAETVLPGDRLQALDKQCLEVRAVLHFGHQYMDDRPASLNQKGISSCLFGCILMPIIAINLQCNAHVRQGEINKVTPNRIFLEKGNLQDGQDVTHQLLRSCFALKPAITAERAILSVLHQRMYAKALGTCSTCNDDGRAAAYFRTIDPSAGPFALKDCPATCTWKIDCSSNATCPRTNGIALCDGHGYAERALADRTELLHQETRPRFKIACSRTIASIPPLALHWRDPKSLPALLAGQIKWTKASQSQATSRTIASRSFQALSADEMLSAICTVIGERHRTTLASLFNDYSINYSIPVYDIEIEKVHAFYAAGFLVHNCQICRQVPGMNADGVPVDQPFTTPIGSVLYPPLHPQCRCTVTLIIAPSGVSHG